MMVGKRWPDEELGLVKPPWDVKDRIGKVIAGRGIDAPPFEDSGRTSWSAISADVVIGQTRTKVRAMQPLATSVSHRSSPFVLQHLFDAWWLTAVMNVFSLAPVQKPDVIHSFSCCLTCLFVAMPAWLLTTLLSFRVLKSFSFRVTCSLSFLLVSLGQTFSLFQVNSWAQYCLPIQLVPVTFAGVACNLAMVSYVSFIGEVVAVQDLSSFLISRPFILLGSSLGFCLAKLRDNFSFHQNMTVTASLCCFHLVLTAAISINGTGPPLTSERPFHVHPSQAKPALLSRYFVCCLAEFSAGAACVGCMAFPLLLPTEIWTQVKQPSCLTIAASMIASSLCCIVSATVIRYATQDHESFVVAAFSLSFLCWPLLILSLNWIDGVMTSSGLFVLALSDIFAVTATNLLWNLALALLMQQEPTSNKLLFEAAALVSTFCGVVVGVAIMLTAGIDLFLKTAAFWLLGLAVLIALAAFYGSLKRHVVACPETI